jgi:hypothetical protein
LSGIEPRPAGATIENKAIYRAYRNYRLPLSRGGRYSLNEDDQNLPADYHLWFAGSAGNPVVALLLTEKSETIPKNLG